MKCNVKTNKSDGDKNGHPIKSEQAIKTEYGTIGSGVISLGGVLQRSPLKDDRWRHT